MTLVRCESLFGREVARGAHQIGPSRRGIWKGGYSRSYLFEDDDATLTLVDTGWDADAGIILRYLEDIGRSPSEIEHIALTHAHRSHLGGVKRLVELSGANVWCHATEAPIVEGREKAHPIRLWPPLPVRLIPFRIISWLPILKHRPAEVKPEHYVVEGERVGPLTVLHTPGHTEGHLAFRYGASVLAVGDAVATWPKKFSAGWPGFNRDNREYRQSLMRLVASDPDVVCPGHGDAIVHDTADRMRALVRGRKFRRSAMV
jgi:glyoxylase-like metal-dependent hydrolase (beta-lactamase superfamily II)